jgi:hypothetical protein
MGVVRAAWEGLTMTGAPQEKCYLISESELKAWQTVTPTSPMCLELRARVYSRPATTSAGEVLEELRQDGWMVAIHNDYWQNGKLYTFWLVTNRDGRYFKGESSMEHGGDVSALNTIKNAIAKLQQQQGGREQR